MAFGPAQEGISTVSVDLSGEDLACLMTGAWFVVLSRISRNKLDSPDPRDHGISELDTGSVMSLADSQETILVGRLTLAIEELGMNASDAVNIYLDTIRRGSAMTISFSPPDTSVADELRSLASNTDPTTEEEEDQ